MYFPGGLVDIPQCDFSAMIGPDMFREFGLPSLRHECELLDAAEYHLDGPDAIQHLPAVAEIPKITLIQWQPGAGNAATRDWSDLYRRIDAFGKGQYREGSPEDIRRMWAETRCRNRLFIGRVAGISSPDEARRFLESWPCG
jgi:5-methyltetrahydrofolate--homocysteine methyltransferase